MTAAKLEVQIFFLLVVMVFTSYGQKESVKAYQTILGEKSSTTAARADAYCSVCDLYRANSQLDSAYIYAQKGTEYAIEHGQKTVEAIYD